VSPTFLQTGFNWRLRRLRRFNDVPRPEAKTRASGSRRDGLRPSQDLDSSVAQGYRPSASPGLRIVKPTLIDGLSNPKTASFEIDVVPTKSQQFPNSKTGQSQQPGKRLGRLRQRVEKLQELFRGDQRFF